MSNKVLIITGDGGESYETLYAKHRFEEAEMIRKSAGIRSPPLTSTMSPRTSSRAEMEVFSPFRKARACWGTRFLKLSMIAADFDSCMYFFRVSKVLREKNGSH